MVGGRPAGAPLGRVAAATLFIEAAAVAALRFLTLVYSLARTAYASDRARLGLGVVALWVGVTIVVAGVLVAAAVASHRHPGGAWAGAGSGGRICLALAWLLNAIVVGWAIEAVSREHPGIEGVVAWLLAGLAACVVLAAAAMEMVASRTRTAGSG